jgi:tRNA pseudouridine13 synthase
MGAILSITRGMRMMYIHAYQSYVWNFVASRRWSTYGATVIVGDLVLSERKEGVPTIERDPNDTEIVDDADGDDLYYAQARPLTAEDVASGKYTIFDIVLPTPGFDVMYPLNDIGDYYQEFMGQEENGGLDPFDMRRRHKEFSLSGNYRHLIGRFITEPEYAIRLYSDDTQQMYPTDLDICNHNKKLAAAKIAEEKALKNSEVAATTAQWAHFAQNPAQYDALMTEDRRRKASQSPPADGATTAMKETWVQTGMDGSDKRVKLTRHHDTIETEVKQSSLVVGDKDIKSKDSTEISNETTTNDEEMTVVPSPSAPAAIKEEHKGLSEAYYETIPAAAKEEPTSPAAAPKSVSEAYYEAMAKADIPTLSPHFLGHFDIPKVQFPNANAEETPKLSDPVLETADPLNWYGGKLPTVPVSSAIKTENDGAVTMEDGSTVTKIGKIIMPTFRKPSDNPILSVNDFSHEIAHNPGAKRIAVVLKFQLKCSNYATIVLRELMGTSEGSRPSSSGNGNGMRASSVGLVRTSSTGGSRAPSESA